MTGAAPPSAPPVTGGAARRPTPWLCSRTSRPSRARRPAQEARSSSRRCPTCGGVVPVGMSLCQTCGLDLESGTRIDLIDDLAPPPAPAARVCRCRSRSSAASAAPLSAALVVAAFLMWTKGISGTQYFIPVAAFGGYASVQFLRGKSVKLLLVALTLGAR